MTGLGWRRAGAPRTPAQLAGKPGAMAAVCEGVEREFSVQSDLTGVSCGETAVCFHLSTPGTEPGG